MTRKVESMQNNGSTLSSGDILMILMADLQDVAESADPEEVPVIARRVMQLAEDLSFVASGGGRDQPNRLRALSLVSQVEALTGLADPHELAHVAWRSIQLANDLSFAASEAGAAQRRRLRRVADRELPSAA
jgi:hypothetical protein